jgi:hypothetical protein
VGGVQSVFKFQLKPLPCVKLVTPDLPLLEPDLLDDPDQQGVNIVVQSIKSIKHLFETGHIMPFTFENYTF